MSQFNRNANRQNTNCESNRSSVFRMLSSNGSSDHQWEVPIVPGVSLRLLEETALNNTIYESMGMNVSSPMSSFPVGGDQRFPGRLFGSTILLDQLTPETNTNTRTVSPTITTQGVVVEIHSTGEHEVNSGGGSSRENEQSIDEVEEEEEEEQGGVGGEDMRCLPFKRRSDHPLTIGEGSSNPGRGGGIPRRRVEDGNNTNTTPGGLPMNVGVGTESASAMVSTAAEQDADREPQTTSIPTPTFPLSNQQPASPPCLVYSVVPVEHVPLFYQVQQGYPWFSSMSMPPHVTTPAPATATTSLRGRVPNRLRGYSPPPSPPSPQFGLCIGNGNSTPGPSTIPNRPLQVPNPNGWFRRVNVDEQYMMMPPPVVDHTHAFLESLMTRQTSSTLTQSNTDFLGEWQRLMAQNQRNRQLGDEIMEDLENALSFMNGLTEEQIMSHIGQEVAQSTLENQDTSKNEICTICQEEYVDGEQLGRLDCEHKYHLACIKQWLVLRNNCPICKQTALAVESDDE